MWNNNSKLVKQWFTAILRESWSNQTLSQHVYSCTYVCTKIILAHAKCTPSVSHCVWATAATSFLCCVSIWRRTVKQLLLALCFLASLLPLAGSTANSSISCVHFSYIVVVVALHIVRVGDLFKFSVELVGSWSLNLHRFPVAIRLSLVNCCKCGSCGNMRHHFTRPPPSPHHTNIPHTYLKLYRTSIYWSAAVAVLLFSLCLDELIICISTLISVFRCYCLLILVSERRSLFGKWK